VTARTFQVRPATAAVDSLILSRDNYAAALAADSVSPQPSYSIDGEAVDRTTWRRELAALVEELNATINAMQPYQLSIRQTL
jgi:hypothetical protein